MMPVATLLAIAATFWGQHGYQEVAPVTWNWGLPPAAAAMIRTGNVGEGFAVYGSYHVSLDRSWWDHAENWRKCEVVIHEVGHAAFGFDHQDHSVMSEMDDVYAGHRTVPGICKQWKVKP